MLKKLFAWVGEKFCSGTDLPENETAHINFLLKFASKRHIPNCFSSFERTKFKLLVQRERDTFCDEN